MDLFQYVKTVSIFIKLVPLKNVLNYYLTDIKLDVSYYNYNIIYIKP